MINLIVTYPLILCVKIYQFFISPIIGQNCRYLPTCSEYFIDCLKLNGIFKGTFLGIKRIFKCHPVKFLGGNSGIDNVPKKKMITKEN